MPGTFQPVYDALYAIMMRHAGDLVIVRDEPGDLYIDTPQIMYNKKPLWFGGVKIGKRYVSYHLMPVYVHPPLLLEMTPDLKKRMQGKSCFNFTKVDEALFAELEALTAQGRAFYTEQSFLDPS